MWRRVTDFLNRVWEGTKDWLRGWIRSEQEKPLDVLNVTVKAVAAVLAAFLLMQYVPALALGFAAIPFVARFRNPYLIVLTGFLVHIGLVALAVNGMVIVGDVAVLVTAFSLYKFLGYWGHRIQVREQIMDLDSDFFEGSSDGGHPATM